MVPYTSNVIHFYLVTYVLLARSMTLAASKCGQHFEGFSNETFFLYIVFLTYYLNVQYMILGFLSGIASSGSLHLILSMTMYVHSALLNTERELVAHKRTL
jgi:hypothetical protein